MLNQQPQAATARLHSLVYCTLMGKNVKELCQAGGTSDQQNSPLKSVITVQEWKRQSQPLKPEVIEEKKDSENMNSKDVQ